jgi:hypothetical protein
MQRTRLSIEIGGKGNRNEMELENEIEKMEIANTDAAIRTFRGASLLQPIPYKTVKGLPLHVYAQEHPCPAPSYPAEEQRFVEPSLRSWAKSMKIYATDQNRLCRDRMSRFRTNSKILPVSQTAALWHMTIPPSVPEPSFVNFGTTREDIHAVTELGHKYIERLRLANKRVGIEPIGTKELQKDWNAYLTDALKRPAEIIKVKIIGRNRFDADRRAIRKEERRYREGFVENDDSASDSFEGMHITNDGVRDTTEPVPERKVLFRRWQIEFNPDGLSSKEWEEPGTEHELERFKTGAAEYLTTFNNVPITEAITQTELNVTPAALVKRFARKAAKKRGPDWSKVTGHYFCVVHLNGRDEIKILAPLDATFIQACEVFMKKMRASKVSAAKEEKRKKNKANLNERMKNASARIQQAYGESFIYRADPAFWKPPEGGVVTYSPLGEGETDGE